METVIDYWRWFVTVLHKSNLKKLQLKIKDLGVYNLHNILQQREKVEWCEWHLNINVNDKAIQISEQFHQDFKKLKLSSSIVEQVKTIEETFLKFMPENDTWNRIRDCFKQAREQDNPLLIVTAYTLHQELTCRLNKHSAVNTYHALKLYCTLLNCPILAQTQEYTDAFTRILFHPKLNQYIVRHGTFYRGICLPDKKFLDNYIEGATIITTTFLSTSTDKAVANMFICKDSNEINCFSGTTSENPISIFCEFHINNTNRRTALNISNLSNIQDEGEILILRYAPFKIKSIKWKDDGQEMAICFDECKEDYIVEETCSSETVHGMTEKSNYAKSLS